MANTVIQHKRNSTATVVPSSLAVGELAINLADRKLFTSNGSAVFEIGTAASGANTQIEFNDSGQSNGSANFTYNKSTVTVNLANTLFIGNTTVNTVANSTSIRFANSTSAVTITIPTTTQANGSHYLNGNGSWTVPAGGGGGTPGGSNTWIQYNLSGAFGANSLFTFDEATSRLHIGNTTANATANVTSFRLANSTSNIALTIPTTTQANGSHYLNGNGSWVVVTGGGGGGSTTVTRQYWVANDSVNTAFTVSTVYTIGELDVYQNGIKLLVGADVDASTGTGITLTTPAEIGDIIEVVGYSNVAVVVPTIGTVTIDFGTAPVYSKAMSVAYSNISPGQKVMLTAAAADDEMEMDMIVASAYVPSGNTLQIYAHAHPGPVTGTRTLNVMVG